jgi:hypothetical protein
LIGLHSFPRSLQVLSLDDLLHQLVCRCRAFRCSLRHSRCSLPLASGLHPSACFVRRQSLLVLPILAHESRCLLPFPFNALRGPFGPSPLFGYVALC